MKKSLSLPADFINTLREQQKHRIKSIEDRIEQSWKAEGIILSLNVINLIAGPVPPPPMSEEIKQLLGEMAASAKHLSRALGVENTEKMSQLDIDRSNVRDAVNRNGAAVVLSFINTQLVTDIEKFFSGLVVDYIAMFNQGQRAALPADKIFVNDPDLKALHIGFYNLRDEWYAHVACEDGRHILKYRVDACGEIMIDKNGAHTAPEYHRSEFVNLYKCANHVSFFIEKDLDEKIAGLMKTLSRHQRDILSRHWNSGDG